MSYLGTVDELRTKLLRIIAMEEQHPVFTKRGENKWDVLDDLLTRGTWKAQRYLLKLGYQGWRKRSNALSFSGSDDLDGGQSTELPTDFLRAYGTHRKSALVEPNGRRWGREIEPDNDERKGNFYYIRRPELWIARGARLPSTLYLDYHYRHPEITDGVTIDFEMEARPLIPAEAGRLATGEHWFRGDEELKESVLGELASARSEALDIARSTKQPHPMKRTYRAGNRW